MPDAMSAVLPVQITDSAIYLPGEKQGKNRLGVKIRLDYNPRRSRAPLYS